MNITRPAALGAPWRSTAAAKAFYFAFYAAMASLSPFLVLRYEELGLSGDQIGVLTGLSPLVMLVGASFWGGIADATQQHRRLLRLSMMGVLATAIVLSLAKGFWVLLFIVAVFAFLRAPIMPLTDHSVLEWLGERKDQYGKLRVWGAIGWGVAGPIVGRLVEQFGLGSSFYGCAVFMLGGLIVSSGLPISHASMKQSWWSGARALINDRRWLPFLFVVLFAGIAMSVVHSYLFLYMDELGATGSLMGLALLVATLGEIGVLGFSDRLLIRLGTRKLLMLGLAAHVLRVLLYSLIRMPWLVLPVQLLHGLSFSAIWVASVSHASRLAPEGMGATAQGLFGSVMSGLGTALGSLSGGLLYDSLGFSVMFTVSAAWALIGLALFMLASRTSRRGASQGVD